MATALRQTLFSPVDISHLLKLAAVFSGREEQAGCASTSVQGGTRDPLVPQSCAVPGNPADEPGPCGFAQVCRADCHSSLSESLLPSRCCRLKLVGLGQVAGPGGPSLAEKTSALQNIYFCQRVLTS